MREPVAPKRSCSKQTCNRDAVCTLTYVYSDSTAVIGALSARREPHAYDLCPVHADALTAPRGWRVVRLEAPGGWDRDDLDDVMEAVRQDAAPAVRRAPARGPALGAARPGARVLRDVSYRGSDPELGGPRATDDPAGDGASASRQEPTARVPGYPGVTRSAADAPQHQDPQPRSVPLPDALRMPHWRRP
ncbi:DUF3499 family protein [Kocuria rhizophila]|uniref:DUF3499 family protein n=1 Tax=Kocuria rhizophila TaxID=72000 RepID=UPI0009EC0502|nr:DUF3499 family protein [Kocuria rhizophila]